MMSRFPIVAVGAALVLSACAAHEAPQTTLAVDPADPVPVASTMPDSSVPAAIPSGYIAFCLRNSDQCELPKNAPTIAHLNLPTFELLTRVNRQTNAAIQPEDDVDHYGPADYWTIATDGYGDCEDYALTKRKALIDAGLPVAALRLAVVLTEKRERHAILTVATDRGDFVLDNFSDAVKPWTKLDYTWLSRQDPKKPWRWDMLSTDNATQLASTAASGR